MTDPIADMLTRIRNGYLARRETITVPYSRLKQEIANKLAQTGFVKEVEVSGETAKKTLKMTLRYTHGKPLLTHVSRVSKPSVRVYAEVTKIPAALSGKGITILTTSKGIKTAQEARKEGVGGEVICQVW